MLSLFLHDINDIFFEGGRFLYLTKLQNNQINVIFKFTYKLMWFLCVTSWFITRLYIFPLNVLAFAMQQSLIHNVNRPSFALLMGLSWITNTMNIYWFSVILLLKKLNDVNFYFSWCWLQFSSCLLAKSTWVISFQKMTRNISKEFKVINSSNKFLIVVNFNQF